MSTVPILVVSISFAFIYLLVRLHARDRDQRRRAILIEKALDSGAIDAATKRELLEAVTDKPLRASSPKAHPLLMLGWIGLFVGGGMMVIAMDKSHWEWWQPAIMVTVVSFGMLSLPIAMRELQARKHA